MSQRETNNVAYGKFKGILVAFCDQTHMAVICRLQLARPLDFYPNKNFQQDFQNKTFWESSLVMPVGTMLKYFDTLF